MLSSPEILLLGIESDVDPEEAIRVVPEGSAGSGLIDALGGILQARRAREPLVACTACGDPVLAEADFCPHCGARRREG
jgi:hypothetical protein